MLPILYPLRTCKLRGNIPTLYISLSSNKNVMEYILGDDNKKKALIEEEEEQNKIQE